MAKEDTSGTWMGRRPKGQQDTNSFQSFLRHRPTNCGCRGGLQEHLGRHHRGFNTKAAPSE